MALSDTAADFSKLLDAVKHVLKEKKVTYRELARRSSIPESTLKKLFTGRDCSVRNLLSICTALEISLNDLAQLAKTTSNLEYEFTPEQVDWFNVHPEYYAFLIQIYIYKKSLEQVQREYDLSAISVSRYLSKLEKLGFLERLPEGRVKFLFSGSFHLRPHWPFAKRLLETQAQKLKDFVFDETNKDMYAETGFAGMRKETRDAFVKDIQALHLKYLERVLLDAKLFPREIERVSYFFAVAPLDSLLASVAVPNLDGKKVNQPRYDESNEPGQMVKLGQPTRKDAGVDGLNRR